MSQERDPTPDEFAEFARDAAEDPETETSLLAFLGPEQSGATVTRGTEDREQCVALAGVALRKAYNMADTDDAESFLRDVVADFNDRAGEYGVDQ